MVSRAQCHVVYSGCIVIVFASLFVTSQQSGGENSVQRGHHFYFHNTPPKMASKNKITPKAPKMKPQHGTMSQTDTAPKYVPPAQSAGISIGLPGVVVDEGSGPCTFPLKGGKTCSCQKYSEDSPRDPRNPGCRECTHGHSVHNGRRPGSHDREVMSTVRDVLANSKVANGANLATLTAARNESNLGYRPKDRVRTTRIHKRMNMAD